MSANNEGRNQRKNSRLLAQDHSTTKVLGPIIGYAQEPILPLGQACIPLVDIVHDILTYASLALEHTPDEPADGLTRDESASIRLYTLEWTGGHRGLYSMLNKTLKTADREDLRPWFQYLKLFLTALVKIECVSLHLWRGLRKDVSSSFPSGAPVTWWGFSSCTFSLPVLENELYLGNKGERTLFSIDVINGRNIRAHSEYDNEDEFLLLPGTYMEVQSQFSPAPDLNVIHLKQKIPEEMLLEPPFEGARIYPEISTEPPIISSKRPWYNKKRFLIPIGLLVVMSLLAAILSGVLASRSTGSGSTALGSTTSTTPTTTQCLPYYTCDFSTYTTLTNGYFGLERLYINCTQSLSNITVIIAVQKTVDAIYLNQYNTFWSNTVEQSYQNTSSAILYMWRIISGQTILLQGFPFYTEAQFDLQGINQTLSNDTYLVTTQSECSGEVLTYTGHF